MEKTTCLEWGKIFDKPCRDIRDWPPNFVTASFRAMEAAEKSVVAKHGPVRSVSEEAICIYRGPDRYELRRVRFLQPVP